ncbi:MAG: 50S ribosomal protein L18 [Candidatus Niyogibacteria bacterium]|nr:50S ribosomal protein L18 [Candidatus Niyogibacteria bacterium]
MKSISTNKRIIRHKRLRGKVSGTPERPRLSIYRSNQHLYLQVIDDEQGKTLVGLGDYPKKGEKKKIVGTKTERAKALGMEIAKLAIAKKIKKVVFDRGGFTYHGNIKAAAEGAREGGLEF